MENPVMASPRHPVQKRNVRSRASVHGVAALALVMLCGFTAPYVFGGTDQAGKHTSKSAPPATSKVLKGLPITELTETEAILHALKRLGYGPRPGAVEHIREIGLAKGIDAQLNPSSID